jgi:hypothetical protein
MAAVIDGVLHDTHECDRGGTRGVYGYYIKRNSDGRRSFASLIPMDHLSDLDSIYRLFRQSVILD